MLPDVEVLPRGQWPEAIAAIFAFDCCPKA